MTDDPIVTEVRKARREILESHAWDCRKMLEDAMKRQMESGVQVVKAASAKPREGIASRVYEVNPQR